MIVFLIRNEKENRSIILYSLFTVQKGVSYSNYFESFMVAFKDAQQYIVVPIYCNIVLLFIGTKFTIYCKPT